MDDFNNYWQQQGELRIGPHKDKQELMLLQM